MQIILFFVWSILFISSETQGWFFSTPQQKPFTLLLDAGGDSAHPGRSIDDSFESTITLEIAHALKNKLLQLSPATKIIINRAPGEVVAPLQNANFANKLTVNLVISIHAFYQPEGIPQIFLYQFFYGHSTTIKDGLSFYPFDTIYLLNSVQTNNWAEKLYQSFSANSLVKAEKVNKIPFKPLIGIKASAIGIEFGLKNKSSWHTSIDSLVSGLLPILNGLST